MWIRTQNKQRIINTDQIVDIFVDKTGTKIYAESTIDRDFLVLGEYENRDTCLTILTEIHVAIGAGVPIIEMPLGGDVDTWKEAMTIAEKAYLKLKL